MRGLITSMLVLLVGAAALGTAASATPPKPLKHRGHAAPAKGKAKKPKAKPLTAPRTATPSPPAAPAPLAHDPSWDPGSPLGALGLDALWRLTEGTASVVIAVVDTGVDVTRPDLAGAALPGYDVVDGSADVSDTVGHGTAVAEVAVGRGDNGVGGTGVCWHCALLPVKVAPNGFATGAAVAAGIRWAADHGANVINVSLVLGGPDPAVESAVAYAASRNALVVAAAGNSPGTDPTYPAAYPGVVGVVAVDPSGKPYDWARHGSWAAVAAPGCVPTADARGGTQQFCGSSAAAPVVSGLAGLLWSGGGSSAAAVGATLASTADPLPGVAAGGLVDARALANVVARR